MDPMQMIMSGRLAPADVEALERLEPLIRHNPEVLDNLDQLMRVAEAVEQDDDGVDAVAGPVGLVATVTARASDAVERWVSLKHTLLSVGDRLPEYPPGPKQAAGIAAGWAVILGVAAPVWLSNSIAQDAMAGDPSALLAATIAASIGLWLVARDLPTVEDALA